jgi:hypothetical protein
VCGTTYTSLTATVTVWNSNNGTGASAQGSDTETLTMETCPQPSYPYTEYGPCLPYAQCPSGTERLQTTYSAYGVVSNAQYVCCPTTTTTTTVATTATTSTSVTSTLPVTTATSTSSSPSGPCPAGQTPVYGSVCTGFYSNDPIIGCGGEGSCTFGFEYPVSCFIFCLSV